MTGGSFCSDMELGGSQNCYSFLVGAIVLFYNFKNKSLINKTKSDY